MRRLSFWILAAGVYGFVLSELLGRGTYELALILCGVGVGLTLLLDQGRRNVFEAPFWWLCGLSVALLVPGVLMAGYEAAAPAARELLSMLLAVTAMLLLSATGHLRASFVRHGTWLMLLFVAVHVGVLLAGGPKQPHLRTGWFSNIHYLAQFAAMLLPVIIYLLFRERGVFRAALMLALAADFWLLLTTQSRPGYVAVLLMSLSLIAFLRGRRRWFGLAGLLLAVAGLYASRQFEMANRVDDFVTHFDQDERWVIWRNTDVLQSASSALQWVFGHGFGHFYATYKNTFDPPELWLFSFPHHYYKEILYSSGFMGVLLVLAGHVLWYGALIRAVRRSPNAQGRQLGLMLLAALTAEWGVTFFAIPFFSRHNLLPLSLLLGATLVYLRSQDHGVRYG